MAGGFHLAARVRSFAFALNGLKTVFLTQHNAWTHACATIVVVVLGLVVGLHPSDWKWLVLTLTIVWFAEVMNTAFEYLCDVVSPEYSDAVRHAKDIAAGAVLMCAFGAIVMGVLIFWPYLIE